MTRKLNGKRADTPINPKSRNRKSPKAPYRASVRYVLDQSLKEAVKQAEKARPSLIRDLLDLSGSGYKVGFGWDYVSDCYYVSLLCEDWDNPNAGLLLGARHEDMQRAAAVVWTLHYEVYDGQWPDNEVADAGW